MRLAGENAFQGGPEFLGYIVNRGDDHGHVVRGERRFGGNRCRLVPPVAHAMNEKSQVAMDPEDDEEDEPAERRPQGGDVVEEAEHDDNASSACARAGPRK